MTDAAQFEWKGQAFTVTGAPHHTNRHGYPAPLLVLTAACKQCGMPFETAVRKARRLRLERCRKRCFECNQRSARTERAGRPTQIRVKQ
jgi:hypothetical protein